MLEVKQIVVGQLKTNCYLVIEEKTKRCLIIDPGDDAEYIIRKITDEDAKPLKIIATHGHFDHILAVNELKIIYGIPFAISKQDLFLLRRLKPTVKHFLGVNIDASPPSVDEYLNEKKLLKLAKFEISIIETPGHTPGSVTFYCRKAKAAFVGDLVFEKGATGRVDFSYSEENELKKSLKKILKLPLDTFIYSGHGKPSTLKEIKDNLLYNKAILND